MSHCEVKSDGETTSITCYRGSHKPMHVLKHATLDNVFKTQLTKEKFDILSDTTSVEVFDNEKNKRKFLKSFLQWVEEE